MLDIVAVARRVRGTGVGAALMAYAEERARDSGSRGPPLHQRR